MPDFKTLCAGYPADKDYPERTHRLLALTRVIDGELYDQLGHPFNEEYGANGEYIPLSNRRPSARTRFCRTVVNDSVSLLFSEGHFPTVECTDEDARNELTKLMKEARLNCVMTEAATYGSAGSIAILLRILKNRPFFTVMQTAYLTPEWDDNAPDTLKSVTERYKVKGQTLKESGYTIKDDDLAVEFWFQREWNAQSETWYKPIKVRDEKAKEAIDTTRTVKHNLGFVPIVWVKNLPGGNDIDGAPTFPIEAIDTQIEADYLLSQGGRGLKYQSDPTLHIKEPAVADEPVRIKGAANAIVTQGEKSDVKLLEISGDAASAVMEWVKGLREIALEAMGGNRSNADKLSTAQSGRAMELMNQSLIWLSDKLRISYGEGALLELVHMVVKAANQFPLKDKQGRAYEKLTTKEDISLRWPHWYAPTYADKQTQAMTLDVLRNAGLLSRDTAVKSMADSYDIEDIDAEIKLIDSDPLPPAAQAVKDKQQPLSNSDD